MMKYVAKLSGIAFLATWLAIGPICAAYAATWQTVYVKVEWTIPASVPERFYGEDIEVKVVCSTGVGTAYVYTGTATLDYQQCNVSCVMETTGLPGGYHWGVISLIKTQILADQQGHVVIEAPATVSAYREGVHDFSPEEYVGMLAY